MQNGVADVTVDPAFVNVGQKHGLEIWRIEKMQVVPQRKQQYGKFYSGDAYIILSSVGEPTVSNWNVHFWLGNNSSQDEQGVAAYKTVELDDSLGGYPVQYREVQGHESKLFLSYFKSGIRYLEGGIESGFRHVGNQKFEKRLFQIKGRRNCRVQQVEPTVNSLNQGDVFVFDIGRSLFVWAGPDSNRGERTRGAEVAREIRDEERSGRATIHLIDDGWATHEEFYKELDSHPGHPIAPASAGGDDTHHEERGQSDLSLFKVSDATGKTLVTKVEAKPLKKDHLDTNDCFILDMGTSGIYAWVGKGCTPNEKKTVWEKATDYLKKRGLPKWTPIQRVNEGTEPPIFKAALHWPAEPLLPTKVVTAGSVAQIDKDAHKVDAGELHGRSQAQEQAFMPDAGDGEVSVWRIENFFMRPVDRLDYGTFYSGDSYVVLYKYMDGGMERGVVYFWLGLKSSTDERASAAIMATRVDEKEMNGRAIQIRVVQNKEPAHLLKIFEGRMVVLSGGHASGFRNVNDTDSYDVDGTRLFQVRDGRVIQVAERAASLNSNDVFVLETPRRTYLWHGKGSSQDERNLSRNFAKMVIPIKNPNTFEEGDEPGEFWAALGGKGEYASGGSLDHAHLEYTARLFHCSNARGYFHVEEIVDFSQEDLIEDDVMLLDTYDQVFVWVGDGANDEEKREAMKTALEYIRTDPIGRSEDNTVILSIRQGAEPPSFTGHFGTWDADLWSEGLTYDELKRQLGVENVKAERVDVSMSKFEATYPLDVLRQLEVPEGVDRANKENHLSEDDFESLFGINRREYSAMPQWKRIQLKKKTGLF